MLTEKKSGVMSADNDKSANIIDIPYFLNHLKSLHNRRFSTLVKHVQRIINPNHVALEMIQ